jgi:periplasmic protein TonB
MTLLKLKKFKQSEYLEVVFEFRNKAYGAYPLRKGYDAAVSKGLYITIALVLIPLGIYCYYLWYPSEREMIYSPYIGNVQMYNDLISPSEIQRLTKQLKPLVVENSSSLVTPEKLEPVNKKKGQVVPDSTVTKSDSISSSTSRNGLPGDTAQSGSTDVFYSVEVMPQFPGGIAALQRYISENIRSAEAMKPGASGTVKICFYVRKDGFVDNVKVIKSVDPLLDAEAVRVIRLMPRWTPGYHHGRPVIVMFSIPITFMPVSSPIKRLK